MQIKNCSHNFRYVFAFHLNWRHLRHAKNTCTAPPLIVFVMSLFPYIHNAQNVATLLSAKRIKLPLFRMKIDFRTLFCFLSLFRASIFYLFGRRVAVLFPCDCSAVFVCQFNLCKAFFLCVCYCCCCCCGSQFWLLMQFEYGPGMQSRITLDTINQTEAPKVIRCVWISSQICIQRKKNSIYANLICFSALLMVFLCLFIVRGFGQTIATAFWVNRFTKTRDVRKRNG